MASKTDVIVYIGRFSPFHLGHAHVLEQAIKASKLTIVLIGSSFQARSLKNPFTFEEREHMIRMWATSRKCDQQALIILPLVDHPYNDTKWIEQVQNTVKKAVTSFTPHDTIDISITGSDRDESTWYLHSFPQWQQALVSEYSRPDDAKVNATSVRNIMYGKPETLATPDILAELQGLVTSAHAESLGPKELMKKLRSTILHISQVKIAKLNDDELASAELQLRTKLPPSSASFVTRFMATSQCSLLRREQAFVLAYKSAWSSAPYEPIFVTTDAVVVQSGHVLLVKRGAFPGEGLWALPGGFIDPQERLINCVVREIMEETDIRLAEGKKGMEITRSILTASIKDKEIFDKPDRSSRGRTITTAFLIQLDDTKPLPKVKGMNAPLHETNGVEIVETIEAGWVPISDALARTDMWFEDHAAILATMISRLAQAR